MKKIVYSFIVVGLLIMVIGCGKKVVDETLVEINENEFHLDKKMTFHDLEYTIVGEFKEVNNRNYVQYNYYQEDSSNLLFFRIFYYEGKTIDDASKDLGLDSGISYSDGKTDNIQYKSYFEPRDDGGTIHFYFINKDGNIYVLHFVSKYDIKDFEAKVLKSVKFKEAN